MSSEPIAGLQRDVAQLLAVLDEAAERRALIARQCTDDAVVQVPADQVDPPPAVLRVERDACVEARVARLKGQRIERRVGLVPCREDGDRFARQP